MTGAAALAFAGGTGGGSGGGGGSGSVTLNNANIEAQSLSTASAGWKIDSDGNIYETLNGGTDYTYQWTADAVANYEVRATKTAGSNPTGSALASWLACSSDREWTVSDTVLDEIIEYSYLTIEVRDAATTVVKASCTVNLIAEKI